MYPIVIEFCINNIVRSSKSAKEELEKDMDLDIIETTCRGFCGLCARNAVAIVNHRPVVADTPDELVIRVYEYIDNHLL